MSPFFEEFIQFILRIESKGQLGLFTVCYVNTKRTIQFFSFKTLHMCVWPEMCSKAERQLQKDLSPLF